MNHVPNQLANHRVRLFAAAKVLAERGEILLDLPLGSTVAAMQLELVRQVPALAALAARSMWAINGEYAQAETVIPNNAEVALIPPVSGG